MKIFSKNFLKAPLLVSVAFFLVSCFAFGLLYKNIQKNNQIFKDGETKWQLETSKKDEVESLNKLLSKFEKERALLDTHFTKSSDVVPFLDAVEKLAQKVNAKAKITVVDISPEGTNLSVGVSVNGNFESIYKFLLLLENSPYQLEFTSMSMKKVGADTALEGLPSREWSALFKIKLLSFVK